MHEGPDLSTTPPVPPQRVPTHDTSPATRPEPGDAEEAAAPGPSESDRNGSTGSEAIESDRLDSERSAAASEAAPEDRDDDVATPPAVAAPEDRDDDVATPPAVTAPVLEGIAAGESEVAEPPVEGGSVVNGPAAAAISAAAVPAPEGSVADGSAVVALAPDGSVEGGGSVKGGLAEAVSVEGAQVEGGPVVDGPVVDGAVVDGAAVVGPVADGVFVAGPAPDGSVVGGALVGPPVEPELGAAPKAQRRMRALMAGGAGIAVLVAGFVVLKPGSSPEAAARAAPSDRPAPSASAAPATPYDKAVAALDAQTAALVNGDENGWLAAVDPKLKAKYRSLFQNLRGLGVSGLHYEPGVGQPVMGDATAVAIRADLVYCFTAEMCPEHPSNVWEKAPRIAQKLTLKPVGGAYVITAVGAAPKPDSHQPTPWESGDLTFAQGKRVVVAAGAGEQKYLKTVLPVAEHAATIADHYAALNGTTQKRYRIFLASEKQWKTWYGGENDKWAIGLAMPLNKRGIDVIIRMADMDDALTLSTTVQHELGHVVTLTGAFQYDVGEDTWLSEGIAEYIGWKPRSAAQSLRRYSVRWQLNRSPMKSMVPSEPGSKAPARAGDAFYGLSHLAVDCMAHQYGDVKLLKFVRLVLTDDNELDQAAHDAYGLPFKTVDKTCVGWIKKQV